MVVKGRGCKHGSFWHFGGTPFQAPRADFQQTTQAAQLAPPWHLSQVQSLGLRRRFPGFQTQIQTSSGSNWRLSVNAPVWRILWDEKPAPTAPLRSLGISRLARRAAGAAVLAGPRGLHGSTAGRRTADMPTHPSANTPKLSLYFCNVLTGLNAQYVAKV